MLYRSMAPTALNLATADSARIASMRRSIAALSASDIMGALKAASEDEEEAAADEERRPLAAEAALVVTG
jgi:hypothetical protein